MAACHLVISLRSRLGSDFTSCETTTEDKTISLRTGPCHRPFPVVDQLPTMGDWLPIVNLTAVGRLAAPVAPASPWLLGIPQSTCHRQPARRRITLHTRELFTRLRAFETRLAQPKLFKLFKLGSSTCNHTASPPTIIRTLNHVWSEPSISRSVLSSHSLTRCFLLLSEDSY